MSSKLPSASSCITFYAILIYESLWSSFTWSKKSFGTKEKREPHFMRRSQFTEWSLPFPFFLPESWIQTAMRKTQTRHLLINLFLTFLYHQGIQDVHTVVPLLLLTL